MLCERPCEKDEKKSHRLGENSHKYYPMTCIQNTQRTPKTNQTNQTNNSNKNCQEIWTDNLPKNIQMAKKATKKLLSNIND